MSSPSRSPAAATLAERDRFDTIIDVRSPAEFAEDHIPGAINCPVLDDAQRAEIGTLYKQVSPFVAKRLGAAYVSENIARHLRQRFAEQAPEWKPLIYCWRGGKRSGSMTTVFRQIGWDARQLEGGYKCFRRHVVEALADVPTQFSYHVVGGATGSGKSRVLAALAARGAQVLDLEGLACHKGSVLGVLPDQPQPSQKRFESLLLTTLQTFTPDRPVFVEAESRKIGVLHVPEALITAIRAAPCTVIDATLPARVAFLLQDYDYFIADRTALAARLDGLRSLRGNAVIDDWLALADAGEWAAFVESMLTTHYDPLYEASQARNYSGMTAKRDLPTDDLSPAGIERLAAALLAAP